MHSLSDGPVGSAPRRRIVCHPAGLEQTHKTSVNLSVFPLLMQSSAGVKNIAVCSRTRWSALQEVAPPPVVKKR